MIGPQVMRRLEDVAERRCQGNGPAHDWQHVLRVRANARRIAVAEGADPLVAATAALLHELFNYPKDHPDAARSGDVCAEHAQKILREAGAEEADIEPVCAAIRDHAFSKGIVPESLEARVLQDADRLDAVGAIGIARCFATAGELRRPFYDPDDPFCRGHVPDDRRFSLDHFYRKLLRIESTLHTEEARKLARERVAFLRAYLTQLEKEIG
jgi:uncharacterized protein